MYKRYNPVRIKPALTEPLKDKVIRETNLLNDLKTKPVVFKTVKPNTKETLRNEIKKGIPLKSITTSKTPPLSKEAPQPPTNEPLIDNDFEDDNTIKNLMIKKKQNITKIYKINTIMNLKK